MSKVFDFIKECHLDKKLEGCENQPCEITEYDFYHITKMVNYYKCNITVISAMKDVFFQKIENIKYLSHTVQFNRLHINNNTHLSQDGEKIESITCELLGKKLNILVLNIVYKNGLVVDMEIEFK